MNALLIFVLTSFITSVGFSGTKISISDLPLTSYLYREINAFTRSPEEIEKAQLRAHDALEDLVKDFRGMKIQGKEVHFFRIDFKDNKILETCLEIPSSEKKKVSSVRMRQRPAGKYLVYEYRGPARDLDPSSEIKKYVSDNHLKLKKSEAWQYKKSVLPKEMSEMTFLLPIE